MTLLQGLVYVVLHLVNAKMINSLGYNFPVHSTNICPMNDKAWSNASLRMHCNDTHGYHCVPDKNFSSLIEFCYPLGRRIPFQKGNCLELAYTGILNHVKCGHFSYGCPDKDYFSNEIYQYPACLRVADSCFAADLSCLKTQYFKPCEKANCTCPVKQSIKGGNTFTALVVTIALLSVFVLVRILVPLFIKCLKIYKKKRPVQEQDTATIGLIENNIEEIESPINDDVSERPEVFPEFITEESKSQETNMFVFPESITKESESQEKSKPDEIFKMILTELNVEDAELFRLLKRQCLNSEQLGFNYLIDTRVKELSRKHILHQRDENGRTLLHYAAIGGSICILEYIISNYDENDFMVKCCQGRTILDYALQYNNDEMAFYIIGKRNTKPDKETLDCKEQKGVFQVSRVTYMPTFEPIHLIAIKGNLKLLNAAIKSGYKNVSSKTKSGLDILSIGCLAHQNQFCKHVIKNEKELLTAEIGKWNVCHYAAMSGNLIVLKLIEEEKKTMLSTSSKLGRIPMHVACEFKRTDIVKHLIETCPGDLLSKDIFGWSALQFAVKGGDLNLFMLLIDQNLDITTRTNDGKTLLHIASIHKQFEICEFLAKTFSQKHTQLLNETTNTKKKWTAAHYIGVEEKGDGSEEKILDIMKKYGVKLSETTGDGFTIFDIAIYHSNSGLVQHILKNEEYIKAMDISQKTLKEHLQMVKNKSIKSILNEALQRLG
ncbi:uncharacterized protein LOC134282465 [Saccostrea cucullata]|uniref:uncharacterized protein LOC134282465 n=1 Tax=Saccostrea cuccullata TaxID=36930 RepID=UPI002ED207D4